MQTKKMAITLESNGKTLEIGKGQPYRLRSITGLEAAPVTLSSSSNAGMDGATVTSARLEPRSIVLGGTIAYLDGMEELRERLVRFMDPSSEGVCTVDYCGTKRKAAYRIESFAIDEMVNLWAPVDFTISLYCPNPMLKSVDSYGRNIAAYVPQFAFPFRCTLEKKQIMGYRKTSNTITIHNNGDKEIGLKAVITAEHGPVSDPSIKNEDTGKFIQVHVDMQQGDTLIVSTMPRQKRIEFNGENAMMHMDRTSDLTLGLGKGDNLLSYEAGQGRPNMSVRLYYTPEYLGV